MTKKTNTWNLIFKQKKEEFELLSHFNHNKVVEKNEEYEEEVFDVEENCIITRPVSVNWSEKTITPYINMKDSNGIKHVEVGYFTPRGPVCVVGEKEWLDKSVDILHTAVVRRITVVLEKNEDKVKLSMFNFCKSRQAGHRYFRKQSDDIHITFNLKSKNFYVTTSIFNNRKKRTSTTKNDFSKIISRIYPMRFINPFVSIIHPDRKQIMSQNPPQVSPLKFLEELIKELDVDINLPENNPLSPGELLGDIIMKWFIKVWGIKTSNNYTYYLLKHYPGIKKLRKYKMNLIHTILNERGLKGKFYNRLLNVEPECNVTDLHFLKYMLGDNYVKQIHPHLLGSSRNFEDTKYTHPDNLITHIGYSPGLTKYEKKNIISIYNTCSNPELIGGLIDLLMDHFKIKYKLLGYGVNKKIKAKTLDKFNDEHSEWSNLIHACERTTKVNYIYPSPFLQHMEKPIQLEGVKYFVKVLKNDNDYFKEGQIQHHCVRSYLDRYKSIIISVRKYHDNGNERMTCEFLTNSEISEPNLGKDYSNTPTLVQTRMKYNTNPEGNWEIIKKILRKEFLDYVCKPRNNTRPYIKITNNITHHIEILKYNSENDRYLNDTDMIEDISPTISPPTITLNYQNSIRDDLPF